MLIQLSSSIECQLLIPKPFPIVPRYYLARLRFKQSKKYVYILILSDLTVSLTNSLKPAFAIS